MPETKKTPPKDKPKPQATPRATLPPPRAGIFGRPQAGSPVQRDKRRGSRPAGTLTAAKKGTEAEILLYGTIGQDWFGEGITSVAFDESLKSLGGDVQTIRLRVNSGGGDVFEATAIYNMLVKLDAKIIVEIEGVAASAATLISMAGDEVRISENAHFMIHAASGMAWGNAEQLRNYLKLLDNADALIRTTYAAKTGIDDAELQDMMSFDNWMTAQEALDNGFVDAIDGVKKVKPHVTPEDSVTPKHIGALSDDRLAAFSGYLSTLAAAVCPKPTGDSPQSVSPLKKESEMKLSALLRAKCVVAGMPADLSDDAAEKWYAENEAKVLGIGAAATTAVVEPPPAKTNNSITEEGILNLLEAREKRAAENRSKWRKEVDASITLAFGDSGAPAGLSNQCYDLESNGDSRVEDMRTMILAAKKAADQAVQTGGVRIQMTEAQRDKHVGAIRAGVLHRALSNFAPAADAHRVQKDDKGRWEVVQLTTADVLNKHLPASERPAGWEGFAQMPLIKIAEQALIADGFDANAILKLSGTQIAMTAMGFGSRAGIRASALHTTGSLAEITRDAINKSLLAGYEEAPQTWRGPGRQAASVADFKQIHRVKLGAAGNLPVWNDTQAPEQAKLSNEKESYAVEARAETLKFSWRLVINDDLDALSRRPQLLGDAAARTVNAVFWQQVTSNPTMADAVSLFSTATGARKRDNLITGSATPTNSTIGSMRKLMRLMRGLNTPEGNESEDVLNLTPSFIVGPAALEELILKQVNSSADPASGGNSGVFNTARSLTPVIEPLLDASSATAWYLFASPGRVDTVEVTFLMGQETPFAHEWMDNENMAQCYTIIQSFAAKAIDYRGVIKHAGA